MSSIIKSITKLGPIWETLNPFLFSVHHQDAYPKGTEQMGPEPSLLKGHNIGMDFDHNADWRMYHGQTVPGFPAHPHRGFETITVVLEGFVDHFDSNGAAGRYGKGDVQWMTAGSGLQHSEMFPLVNQNAPNPLELFQIWINLPKINKLVEPYYKMLWSEDIPIVISEDQHGLSTSIRVITGDFTNTKAPKPVPDSWAYQPENQVAIWIVSMDPNAETLIPATKNNINRSLYFFEGDTIRIEEREISQYQRIDVLSNKPIKLKNGTQNTRILLLQGNPISEPIVQHGPFVMNTQNEIVKAFEDFRNTQFGGWPWERNDPVHPMSKGRFARYHDGTIEERTELIQ